MKTQATLWIPSVLLAAGLLMLCTATAWGADLSGTYTGQEKCKVWTGEKSKTKSSDRQLQITDLGDTFVATFVAGAAVVSYEGQLIDGFDSPEKAQGAGIACEIIGGYDWSSIVIEKSLDKGAQKGTLRAKILRNLKGPPAMLENAHETCTFNGKRVDTADPGLSCP